MSFRTSRGGGANENGYFLEEQNDDMVDGLSTKISALKRVTIAIGDDVREQNRLLNGMESDFDSSLGSLTSTMKRLGIISKAGGKNVLCYLVMFSFFAFLMMYYFMF